MEGTVATPVGSPDVVISRPGVSSSSQTTYSGSDHLLELSNMVQRNAFIYEDTLSSKDPVVRDRLRQTMHREACRLKSFENFPGAACTKLLAANGFFYTQTTDNVQCYFCEVIVGSWEENDDVTEHHFKYSPTCPLLNNKDHGKNVPLSAVITAVIQDTVSNYINEQRKNNIPITSSLDPKIEYRMHAYLEDSINIKLPPQVNPIVRDPAAHGPFVSDENRRKQQELEDQITCKICAVSPSTQAFLPCGHLCCCYTCAKSYLESNFRCPVCRTPISQSVKIFF
ncbi:baculoviral IAP repeat-containing protein 2-like [Bombus terrestris]|uniref:Baculoviral IAP repeat-containing protein 2-like n=1 Tax=Bombus terrestris TaxID=30195 RepID=A0A9C6SWY4_BOMTE|nr:baculoviral IAP repeat-containing protein 2-like [Bombus terrestris]